MTALPPATLEGWYALHQVLSVDWVAVREQGGAMVAASLDDLWAELGAADEGWSVPCELVGAGADWLWTHLRPSLEELAVVQRRMRQSPIWELLEVRYEFLSVTEAGMYGATADAAREHPDGGRHFQRLLDERLAAERDSAYLQSRLYPRPPDGMPYLSFYPMSKRREGADNWYTLPIEERSRLMREHGLTGRRFAGRVQQMITGAIGLDDWEWGVTLFARDPLDLKRIVTEMRFDEASARYAEFGSFYTGIRVEPNAWAQLLGVHRAARADDFSGSGTGAA